MAFSIKVNEKTHSVDVDTPLLLTHYEEIVVSSLPVSGATCAPLT